MIPGFYHIKIEETEKNENDGSGGASAAGSNDKSSSSANEPEKKILNPQWKNSDGETINKALVGDEVLICADTSGIADGTSVKIKIVEKDDDGKDDDVATISGTVKGEKIECKWKVIYTADEDDSNSQQEMKEKGYTLPEYAFIVECDGIVSEESGQLDVYADFVAKLSLNGKILRHYPYILKLADGSCRKGATNSDGYIIENELPIGKVQVL